MAKLTPRVMTDIGPQKLCASCGEYWPADNEFFRCKDGYLRLECRACTTDARLARDRPRADVHHHAGQPA